MRGNKILVSLGILLPLLIGAGCSGGSSSLSLGGPKDCGSDRVCFEAEFKNCNKAVITETIEAGLVQKEEIVGKKSGKCEVKSVFTENNLMPDWVGKEQYCMLDNSKSYQDNANDIMASGANLRDYCNGPLIDEFYKLTPTS